MKIIRISAIWCPSCIIMDKVFKKIKKDYPNLEIEEIDYDMDEDLIKQYNIDKILPVNIFMKNDVEIIRLKGEKSIEEIEKIIRENI